MSEKLLSASEAYKQLSSLFGDDSVVRPEDVQRVDIIKTGSPGLDRIIGVGGWPRGRLIQLAGKESSGKTLLSLLAIANWQALDPENCAAFLDAEFTYDPKWAARFGVDNDRLYLVKSNDAAALFTGLVGKTRKNKVTQKISKVAGLFDMIDAKQEITYKNPATGRTVKLNCGKMGVIVLDSIANLETPMETESDVGKQNMAPIARFLSVELKKLTPGIAKSNVAFIAINQVRTDLGKMFGNPESSPGGRALKHACTLMVEVGKLTGADNTLLSGIEENIGHKVRAKVSKNKVANPGKTSDFYVNYNSGIVNTADEIFEVGVKIGFIQKVTAQTYSLLDEKPARRDKVVEFISENLEKVEAELRDFYLSGKAQDASDELGDIDEEVVADPLSGDDDDQYEDV